MATRCSLPVILCAANALAYALNALVTFGAGPFSSAFASGQDNASISAKYQTILTPHGVAFSIWAPIFLGEALCVASQLCSERVRTHPLLVAGASWWFVEVCVAQTAWSPAFAYERMPLSAAFMACILGGLAAIAARQYAVVTKALETDSTDELAPRSDLERLQYWLMQFPFELHLGWIIAAFALNVNILFVAWGGDAAAQMSAAVVSLMMLTAVSLACLFAFDRPLLTIPCVTVWATFWMSIELRNPKPLIAETFTEGSIRSFLVLTASLSGTLALVTMLRWVRYHCWSKKDARDTYSSIDVDGSALVN